MAGDIKDKPKVEQVDVAVTLGIDLPNNLVCLQFNKPIGLLRLSPDEAINIGKLMIDGAQMLIARGN